MAVHGVLAGAAVPLPVRDREVLDVDATVEVDRSVAGVLAGVCARRRAFHVDVRPVVAHHVVLVVLVLEAEGVAELVDGGRLERTSADPVVVGVVLQEARRAHRRGVVLVGIEEDVGLDDAGVTAESDALVADDRHGRVVVVVRREPCLALVVAEVDAGIPEAVREVEVARILVPAVDRRVEPVAIGPDRKADAREADLSRLVVPVELLAVPGADALHPRRCGDRHCEGDQQRDDVNANRCFHGSLLFVIAVSAGAPDCRRSRRRRRPRRGRGVPRPVALRRLLRPRAAAGRRAGRGS